jgi:nucleotide-binding universal stress UspA family protein
MSADVMIVYEPGAAGRAALLHAHTLAAGASAGLTVVAVASRERTDVGCGSCRQGAMFRNEIACECATDALGEARKVIASASPTLTVAYELARGTFRRAVVQAARDHDAAVIVLPARRRRLSRDRVRLLDGRTPASVVVAPSAG